MKKGLLRVGIDERRERDWRRVGWRGVIENGGIDEVGSHEGGNEEGKIDERGMKEGLMTGRRYGGGIDEGWIDE